MVEHYEKFKTLEDIVLYNLFGECERMGNECGQLTWESMGGMCSCDYCKSTRHVLVNVYGQEWLDGKQAQYAIQHETRRQKKLSELKKRTET